MKCFSPIHSFHFLFMVVCGLTVGYELLDWPIKYALRYWGVQLEETIKKVSLFLFRGYSDSNEASTPLLSLYGSVIPNPQKNPNLRMLTKNLLGAVACHRF